MIEESLNESARNGTAHFVIAIVRKHSGADENRTRNLLNWSQTRYHCATTPLDICVVPIRQLCTLLFATFPQVPGTLVPTGLLELLYKHKVLVTSEYLQRMLLVHMPVQPVYKITKFSTQVLLLIVY